MRLSFVTECIGEVSNLQRPREPASVLQSHKHQLVNSRAHALHFGNRFFFKSNANCTSHSVFIDLMRSNDFIKDCNFCRSSKQEDLDDRPLLPTEDKFLRLDDMERFVQDAEEAAMRDNASNDDENAEDEDEDAEGQYLCKIV